MYFIEAKVYNKTALFQVKPSPDQLMIWLTNAYMHYSLVSDAVLTYNIDSPLTQFIMDATTYSCWE